MDEDKNQKVSPEVAFEVPPDYNEELLHTPQDTVFHPAPSGRKKSHQILGLAVGSSFLILFALLGFATYQHYAPTKQLATESLNFLKPEDAVRAYTLDMIAKAKELKSASQSQADIAKELHVAADERRKALLEVLHTDTNSFLRIVQPDGFKTDVPSDISAKTEKSTKVSGTLIASIGDPLEGLNGKNPQAKPIYAYAVVDTAGKRSPVYFDKELDEKFYSRKVTFNAIELGGEYAVQADAVTTTDTTASNSSAAIITTGTTVTKKVAVILFNFKSNPTQPWSKSSVVSTYNSSNGSINSYYNEATYGGLVVAAEGFGYYTVDADTTNCDAYQGWAEQAKNQAIAAGVNLDSYDHVSYVFPGVSNCYWAGMGDVNGRYTWMNGNGTNMMVIGHELGHNFGLQHAQSISCSENGTTVSMSANCSIGEYNDPYDIMGNSNAVRHINTMRKAYLKAVPVTNIATATSGDFTIAPLEQSASTTQVVRVPRDIDSTGKVLNYYYIDYRQPFGYDSFATTSNIVSGVSVHVGGEYFNINKTQLVDMTPGSVSGFTDPALTAGNEFYDKLRNIRIVTKSVSSTGAVVSINGAAGATCVRNAPSVTAQPTSQWVTAGGTLSYTLTVKSNDSSACQASNFKAVPTLPTGFTQTASTYSLPLAPGASGTISVSVTSPSTTVGGSYSVSEMVVSSASTSATTTLTLGYNVYDQTVAPPVVSITNPKDGGVVSGRLSIQAAASTSTDKIVKLELYVNQHLVQTYTNASSLTYDLNLRKIKVKGPFPITVMAYDSRNAVGTQTVTVTSQ
jgi:hypothetical protein